MALWHHDCRDRQVGRRRMCGLDTRWRPLQIDYNRRARGKIAGGGGARFWGWEVVMLFYEIVITVDWYAETRGIPVPKNHKARCFLIKRHLPHLAEMYNNLYGLSLEARYYKGYTMTENEGREAARCHEALVRSIPVQ